MDSCTLGHHQAHAERLDRRSRYSRTSAKLCPVSTCMTGKGSLAGWRLDRKVQEHAESLPPLNQQHRSLALRRHLSQDEDGVGLEKVEVRHQVST